MSLKDRLKSFERAYIRKKHQDRKRNCTSVQLNRSNNSMQSNLQQCALKNPERALKGLEQA